MPDQLSTLPANPFAQIPDGPEDPILGVAVAFQSDVSPHKINLGIGAYRTEAGLPYVLNAVKQVLIETTRKKYISSRHADARRSQ